MATITLTSSGPRLIKLAKSLEALAGQYPTDQTICTVVLDTADWSAMDNTFQTRKIKN